MTINFYLRNPKKDGICAIYASICYDNNRLIVFPGEKVHTGDWINKEGRKNEPKASAKNGTLIGNLFKAEKLYRDTYDDLKIKLGGIVPADIFKKAIADKKNPLVVKVVKPVRIRIVDFFQRTIDDTKNGDRLSDKKIKLKADSIKPYNSTLASYAAYETDKRKVYYMDEISQKLLDDYDKYLTQEKKLALNTKSRYLKTFMLMLRYGVTKKVADKNVLADIKLHLQGERSDSIYLNDGEINDILNITDFKTPLYEYVRDYFIIGCQTGLRFSDYSRIKKEHINNGKIQMIQKKVNERVTVPIHPIVKKILAKYPDGLPKCPPNQVFNAYLKEICAPLPSLQKVFEKKITRENEVVVEKYSKHQLVQSHTARRSFATNEYRRGTPVITIMAITGHKSDKTFLNYVKMDGEEHADLLGASWKK
jgi:integrase